MIEVLSCRLTQFLLARGAIQKDDFEICALGADKLIASIINTVVLLLISVVFNCFIQTCSFLLGFRILRKRGGGYHAKTHFRCFLVLLGNWAVVMVAIFFALRSMSGAAMLAAVLIGSVFAFGVIFAFAPVEHENNPLDEGKRVAERKKARIILCCEIIIAFLLIYAFKFDIAVLLGLGLVAAFVSASMSLIAAKITQRKG